MTNTIQPTADQRSHLVHLVRDGTVAAVAFGVVRVVADLIDLFGIDYRLGLAGAVQSGPYALFAGLSLMASLLLPLGLFGIYAHRGERTGRLGLAGFGLAFLGSLMVAGNDWANAFMAPVVAKEAPGISFLGTTGAPAGLLQTGISLSFVPLTLGLLLMAVAAIRHATFPRWQPALLVAAVVSNMVLAPEAQSLQEIVPRVLVGAAIAVLGWHALRTDWLRSAADLRQPPTRGQLTQM